MGALADGTRLAVSGIGGVRAAASARQLVAAGVTALVSWGMAGGLDPALEPGAILLPAAVLGVDGSRVEADAALRARLLLALSALGPVAGGALLTVADAACSAGDKAALHRDTGAVAVDMESLAIARVAREHRLPFAALRVVVDHARDQLPPAAAKALDADGNVLILRLIGSLAMAPAQLGALLRLAARYRAASRTLATVAATGLLGRRGAAPVPGSGVA
jgi:adenosylhomocysteine nucleosidase